MKRLLRRLTWWVSPRWWSRRLPVAYKMLVGFSLIITVGMGILGVIVLHSQDKLMRHQLNEYGMTIVNQYAASATDPLFTDDQLGMQVLTTNLVSDSHIEGAALFNENGELLVTEGLIPRQSIGDIQQSAQYLTEQHRLWEWGKTIYSSNPSLASYITPVQYKDVTAGYSLITVSQREIGQSFQNTLQTLTAAAFIMVAIALLIAYWVSRRIARPIEQIVAATDAIGNGDFQVYIKDRRRDEIGRINEAVNRMAKNMREKHQVEGVLTRLVSNDVAAEVLSGLGDVGIGSEQVKASVLFVDIVGFTALAEKQEPETVVELLNEYFGYFTQCSQYFNGAVDKFIGDCAMVIFGAPRPNSNHRFDAIACAIVIMQLLERLNQTRKKQGLQPVEARIGINSGNMMAGMIGARERMEYTVIGDAVNLASRIINLAQPGEIVVGEDMLNQPGIDEYINVQPIQDVTVKGKSMVITAYRILQPSAEYQVDIDHVIQEILSGAAHTQTDIQEENLPVHEAKAV